MECACSVLDLMLIYLVLLVKDMSFDKQDASDVTDEQQNTHHQSVYSIKQVRFVIILGFCYQERHCCKTNKYTF